MSKISISAAAGVATLAITLTVFGPSMDAQAAPPPVTGPLLADGSDEDIAAAASACADALGGMVGVPHVGEVIDALRHDNDAVIKGVLADMQQNVPDAWKQMMGEASCAWLVAKLWAQPAQAGGDLAPGEAPLDHPNP
ncbi:MAG: hypothetical protein JOZ09_03950 [Pseudonocardiales bacterium]|nr:hypothetical protein [Pseudonocardiales bacterium]